MFPTDASGNPRHGDEQNEYGLQAAYSLLGVTSRAYVVRADLDLGQLTPSSSLPEGDPVNGTYWVDTDSSKYGVKEWNQTTRKFTLKTPLFLDDTSPAANFEGVLPSDNFGNKGDYCIVVTKDNDNRLYYKNNSGNWVQVEDTFDGGKRLRISSHVQYPSDFNGSTATGSVWVTTTVPSNGASWTVKRYNNGTKLWDTVPAPMYSNVLEADKAFDPANGGKSIPSGTVFIDTDWEGEDAASFKLYRRHVAGVTKFSNVSTFNAVLGTSYSFAVRESDINSAAWSTSATITVSHPGESISTTTIPLSPTLTTVAGNATLQITSAPVGGVNATGTVNFTGLTATSVTITNVGAGYITPPTVTVIDADNTATSVSEVATLTSTPVKLGSLIPAAVAASSLEHVAASWNATTNSLTMTHNAGGEFQFVDGTGTPLAQLDIDNSVANVYAAPGGSGPFTLWVSNWKPLVYEARIDPPSTDPANGRLWYDTNVSEVDIMVHDGSTWVGYLNEFPLTDPAGPLVKAVEPVDGDRSDGGNLVTGDIWVDTSNPDNVGRNIYVYDSTITGGSKWVKQDVTDQSTPEGWLFADARWGTSGETDALTKESIEDLLVSDYLDPDAPDPALYPKGMRLWNTRRSGWNVKKFIKNHIDIYANEGQNLRYNDESMDGYEVDRWVAQYPVAEDGGPQFGRLAQRAQVVNALKQAIDSNVAARDTDTLIFNLIATPGYPEAIQNMIAFNTDRKQTAFVVGDTPFRLEPTGTALREWSLNTNNALDNGDVGGTSYDEYMAMWYPSGYTNDNTGNKIVVPPSHMMLRTIINSDNKSYQWFAPAGLRRGGVDNATSVGYITEEGEFKPVSLYEGLRDVLYNGKVNPIATLTGAGVVAYGQKTRARAASALDRINVARLVVYLRRQLDIMARPYLFEPNDAQTRREIKAAADSLLLELVGLRALYDFITVCDESNNTPARIDRNELWLDIAIEPVKAVEFIYIPLRIKNTGDIAAGL